MCAACKPPDVSETSHWRRRRRQAGRLQQQAEWADYHGGLDAIRSPGHRQQIWHTPGLQDCPLEKIKRILYTRAETSWQWCRMHRQVLFPQSRLLDLTILLAGVDAIRVVTIQAQCHVMRKFFMLSVCMVKAHTHRHTHFLPHTFPPIYLCLIWRCLGTPCSLCLMFPGCACHDGLTEWLGAREVIWLLWWRAFAQPLTLLAHSTEDSSSAAHPFTLLNLIISLQFLPPGNRLINTHTLCPDPVFSHKLITASDLLPALQRLGYIGLTLWENPVMTHIWQAE